MDNNTTATIRYDESFQDAARIKVVGVGGAGGNAVNRMVNNGLKGVEFISINTDKLSLDNSLADVKIPIGQKLTKGLGAGAKPDRGFQAIQEDQKSVEEALKGADMVFITAGMGGGTGTGAAPVVAKIAREMGILSVAVVTKPFAFEGPIRAKNAAAGIDALRANVDTIVIIQNNKVLSVVGKAPVSEAFGMVDDVLNNAVRGICEIILTHGFMQVDFADVRTVMENGGDALMGTGLATGEDKGLLAAEKAISSPLLDDMNINGASGVLINITHGPDCPFEEINKIMDFVFESVGEENQPNIIWGNVEREDMDDKVAVTVIATGFHKDGQQFIEEYNPLHGTVKSKVPSPTQRIVTVEPQSAAPTAQPATQAMQYREVPPTTSMPNYTNAPVQFEQNATGSLQFEGVDAPHVLAEEVLPNPFAQNIHDTHSFRTVTPVESVKEETVAKPVVAPAYSEKNESKYQSDFDEVDYSVPAFLRNNN